MWPNSISKKEEMTWDEKSRLRELKLEYEDYLERNRIKIFKQLPREIRDQIIAEMNINKLQYSIFNEQFEHIRELDSLERKEDCGYSTRSMYGTNVNYDYKFKGIWENIDEEKLMKAYLDAEIDDTLSE